MHWTELKPLIRIEMLVNFTYPRIAQVEKAERTKSIIQGDNNHILAGWQESTVVDVEDRRTCREGPSEDPNLFKESAI